MDKFEIVKQLEVVKKKIQREQWGIAEAVMDEAIRYVMNSKPADHEEKLRDHFASQATIGLIIKGCADHLIPEFAYDVADAMLRYREVISDRRGSGIDKTEVDISKAASNEQF